MISTATLLPYITLALLIAGSFIIQSRKILSVLLAAQIIFAFTYKIIDPVGLLAVIAFWGVCFFCWHNPSSKGMLKFIKLLLIVVIALGFANHLIPGFHNLRVFTTLRLSAASSPFTMYLNFDKTIIAVILAVMSGIFFKQPSSFGKRSLAQVLKISVYCMAVLVPLAMWRGYITFDPKLPAGLWLWAFNNLVFVCFAEEVIFRGIIQNYLVQVARRYQVPFFIPILITSILFATLLLGHLHGGIAYITFATISGVFYGYAYLKTNRLESAILVHFIVNLCHFLLFSYPMAASFIK